MDEFERLCDTRIRPDMFSELELKPRNSRVKPVAGSPMTQHEGRSFAVQVECKRAFRLCELEAKGLLVADPHR